MAEYSLGNVKEVPANFGSLKDANTNFRLKGPCEDTMEFWAFIEDDTLKAVMYTTDGCVDSMICGSAAAYMATGASLDTAKALTDKDVIALIKNIPEESYHCALLAINTLKGAIENYEEANKKDECTSPETTCESCSSSSCSSRKAEEIKPNGDDEKIRKDILVLSGKGGVGKSTVAVNLATSLVRKGKRVGLIDVDIHGPSIPTMFGVNGQTLQGIDNKLLPLEKDGLKIISIGFLLKNEDDPVIWRGPMKTNVIKQFIDDVEWGELDYLIIDCPPGTGDEPMSVIQNIKNPYGALVVTTPQTVSTTDVKKSLTFCKQMNLKVLGIIENMSGFKCSSCGEISNIFGKDGGKFLSNKYNVPFLGSIPIEENIRIAGDNGTPFVKDNSDSIMAHTFSKIVDKL